MKNNKHTSMIAIAQIDKMTVQEAERLFMIYKDNGIVTSGYFDDDCWYLYDEIHSYTFNFHISDVDFKEYFEHLHIDLQAFKRYIKTFIMCLMGDLVIESLQGIIHAIKVIVTSPIERMESVCEKIKPRYLNKVQDFFSILPAEGYEDRIDTILDKIDIAEELAYKNKNVWQRSLWTFESYFRFNDIMRRFWQESDNEKEKLFFFPIWLWWNVSAILPLRPGEFVLTPYDCLTEIDGKVFIFIRRNRIKGIGKKKGYRIKDDYQVFKYQIPEELANQIRWYQKTTREHGISSIGTLFCTDIHYGRWDKCTPCNSRYYTYANLATCLRYFYIFIIQERYGYKVIYNSDSTALNSEDEIGYLHLGDTRHLALINAIAEGVTPMVAMMLAGHDNPDMAAHYYSNIASLIECRTYRQLKKLLKGKQSYAISGRSRGLATEKFIVLEDKSRCYSEKVRKNDFSDCYKALGPSGEVGFCNTCNYHRNEGHSFSDNKEKYINRITSECMNLAEIVKLVRKGKGEKEDIIQALLKLRNSSYSYQQYLIETMDQ